jgi:hypothetical protein
MDKLLQNKEMKRVTVYYIDNNRKLKYPIVANI